MPATIDIKQILIDAGTKYQKEIMTAPLVAFDELKPYFNIRNKVQGKVVGGILSVDANFRPYRTDKGASAGAKIEATEWEAFLGDLVKEFDPNEILGTLYTERTATKADQMKIARLIALQVAKKAGEGLYDELFTAVRNAAGNDTKDLFNGFSTIFANAVTGGDASAAKGNYLDTSATPIDDTNAGDILKQVWNSANRILKRTNAKLYVPPSVIDHYEVWYQHEFGSAPWNVNYTQRKLHSARGKCEFVELDNMEDQDYIYLTANKNMNIGLDAEGDLNEVEIRRVDNPKVVQLFMKTHFGTGFETIQKEFLLGVKFR